ncbi:hypothetical protein [uncultured Hymenobacter sp.]|uniref:hypothetical protein n=1 Tax=uncultured Hymenobacter sp. TaxID=170016 RepID=UPI0035CC86D6
MIALILLPFGLLLLAWPYRLFLEAKRHDRPVVEFVYRVGREDLSLLFFLLLYNAAATVALYETATELQPKLAARGNLFNLAISFSLLALPWLAIAFIVNRLHLSYWRHDRGARLEIDKLQQRAVYTNQGRQLTFATSEVVSIVHYASHYYHRIPWSAYGYHVYTLENGTEIIITCLLYYSTNPAELFSAAQRKTVNCRICWLPNSGSSTHNF